ncbi:hypothetical protein SAMN04487912_10482 [Arthrobacter sp. cf158]|nr:hypothetical protein SAMN04487912_10482 [Arthrobacter sp. cf158]
MIQQNPRGKGAHFS